MRRALLLLLQTAAVAALRAAAVQHSPLGSPEAAAADNIAANLAAFRGYAADADGAELIVFPEASLWAYGLQTREIMATYCEQLPAAAGPVPDDNSTLAQLSGLARDAAATLVVNLCAAVPCTDDDDDDCPDDGQFLYNTLVALTPGGELQAVYHKSHLFGTAPLLDQPAEPDPVAIDVGGWRVALAVCFDVQFREPLEALMPVDAIALASSWSNNVPLMSATLLQAGLARHYGVPVVAANTANSPYSAGGGVYAGDGSPLAVAFNTTAIAVDSVQVADLSAGGGSAGAVEWPVDGSDADAGVAGNCSLALTEFPAPCRVWNATAGGSAALAAEAGGVRCAANVTAVTGGVPLALLAYDRTETYNGTPDALPLQFCALVPCLGGFDCTATFDSPLTLRGFAVRGTVTSAVVFPTAAAGNAEVVDASVLRWDAQGVASSVEMEFFSASVYGQS